MSDDNITPVDPNSALWRLKERLQWTGWLQFIPNAIVCLVLFLLAALATLFSDGVAITLIVVGLILFANLVFDIVTIKFRFHPLEKIPAPLSDADTFDVMRARRACRSFQKRNLTDNHRTKVLELAAHYSAPENCLSDSGIRFEYINARIRVWPVIGAHEFLVAIAPKTYAPFAVINVGRSLQHLVIDATRMGLATCWIGPGADHNSIIDAMGPRFDPARDHIICVCAIGYKSRYKPLTLRLIQQAQHKRLPLSDLFFQDDQFNTTIKPSQPPFKTYGRCFEVCQWSPSSFNAQPTRAVVRTKQDIGQEYVASVDFYAAINSRYYAVVALGIWCANWEIGSNALGKAGKFAVLSAAERSARQSQGLPKYYLSWIAPAP